MISFFSALFRFARIRVFAALSFLAIAFSGSVSADLVGKWRTEKGPEGGYADILVYKCGSEYCAKISKAYGTAAVVPRGTKIIRNMKKKGRIYEGGQVYVTRFKKWVSVRVAEGKTSSWAKVKACLGPVCRNQAWKRLR